MLVVPDDIVVAPSSGQITLAAGALGTSTSNIRTVVISTTGGGLNAAASSAVGLSSAVTGQTTVTLTGTESALSTYLATTNNLLFNGSTGDYKLTIRAQVISGGLVLAENSETADLMVRSLVVYGSGQTAAASPTIATLPSSLAITNNTASALVFNGLDLDDGDSAAEHPLVLTLGVGSGTLHAITTDSSVTVGGSTALRTLTGTASALEAYLQANSVTYTGSASSITVSVARSADPTGPSAFRVVGLLSPSQTPGGNAATSLAVPASVITTAGASVAVPFAATG